jgi:predicted SAM-dependent methyltransferase
MIQREPNNETSVTAIVPEAPEHATFREAVSQLACEVPVHTLTSNVKIKVKDATTAKEAYEQVRDGLLNDYPKHHSVWKKRKVLFEYVNHRFNHDYEQFLCHEFASEKYTVALKQAEEWRKARTLLKLEKLEQLFRNSGQASSLLTEQRYTQKAANNKWQYLLGQAKKYNIDVSTAEDLVE